MKKELVLPLPCSLGVSEAAKWYRGLVPHIPELRIDEYSGDNDYELAYELFRAHWSTKSRLRLAAAQALIDQTLVNEFLQKFSLPSVEEYIGMTYSEGIGKRIFEWALIELTTVTEPEKRHFPGAIGESIGLECQTTDGVYVVTEDGWVKKG